METRPLLLRISQKLHANTWICFRSPGRHDWYCHLQSLTQCIIVYQCDRMFSFTLISVAKLVAPSMLLDHLSLSDTVLVWKIHRTLGIMGPLTHPEMEIWSEIARVLHVQFKQIGFGVLSLKSQGGNYSESVCFSKWPL